jgi:hypothetical protein
MVLSVERADTFGGDRLDPRLDPPHVPERTPKTTYAVTNASGVTWAIAV